MPDSDAYRKKKAFFDRVLTVYGRKPVLEALSDERLQCHALHLADSNRDNDIMRQIVQIAVGRHISIRHHSRQALARISRNGRQDQGVALDIVCPSFLKLADYLQKLPGADTPHCLLALDGISNPQNLGMIIRSATAAGVDGVIWTQRGNAALGPLVIKASAGTVYRAPLLLAESLPEALRDCKNQEFEVCTLEAGAREDLFHHRPASHCVYVLGNESEGISGAVRQLADTHLAIPMRNGVESLNVAVTAGLIAYARYFDR
jgi:23S rRNA (guanosine2251-2'-O)-methyltransferase